MVVMLCLMVEVFWRGESCRLGEVGEGLWQSYLLYEELTNRLGFSRYFALAVKQ